MFPITSRPKSVIVPGKALKNVVAVRKSAEFKIGRGNDGGREGQAEALEINLGGGVVESASYLDLTPDKAEKVLVNLIVDTDMMTPSVCLIPPEEGQSRHSHLKRFVC